MILIIGMNMKRSMKLSERTHNKFLFMRYNKMYMLNPNGDVYFESGYHDRDENGYNRKIVLYNINSDDGMAKFILDLRDAGKEERNQEIKEFFGSILK